MSNYAFLAHVGLLQTNVLDDSAAPCILILLFPSGEGCTSVCGIRLKCIKTRRTCRVGSCHRRRRHTQMLLIHAAFGPLMSVLRSPADGSYSWQAWQAGSSLESWTRHTLRPEWQSRVRHGPPLAAIDLQRALATSRMRGCNLQ